MVKILTPIKLLTLKKEGKKQASKTKNAIFTRVTCPLPKNCSKDKTFSSGKSFEWKK